MILPELKRFPCFADLSDEEREFFADAFREVVLDAGEEVLDRKSTRLNSSHTR